MADTPKAVEEPKTSKFIDFFKNKITKTVSWIVLFVAIASLIIGGAKAEDINNAVVIVGGIIAGFSALIAFITSMVKK